MSRITIEQAVQMTGKSDSTLRRDMQAGQVSYTKDDKGKVLFDPPDIPTDNAMSGHDIPGDKDKVVQLLENQVADLKEQLEKAELRATA